MPTTPMWLNACWVCSSDGDMFPELTLTELVELYAALYSCFPTRAEIAQLLERFGLAQKRARTGQLSRWATAALALALATVNDPQIVLLDEPTTGLDPQAHRGVVGDHSAHAGRRPRGVLTTHSMEEAQSLCDRIGIIDAGGLVALGTPSQLIARHAPPLAMPGGPPAASPTSRMCSSRSLAARSAAALMPCTTKAAWLAKPGPGLRADGRADTTTVWYGIRSWRTVPAHRIPKNAPAYALKQ
ncbi:MAG: hypothetical protein U0Z44_18330 [Kouleothrix sp.]